MEGFVQGDGARGRGARQGPGQGADRRRARRASDGVHHDRVVRGAADRGDHDLQWKRDIDWRCSQLRIDVSKGGKKGLTVPMVPPLMRALKQWRTELAAERLAAPYWFPDHDQDEPDWVLPSMVGTKWETHNLRNQFNKSHGPWCPG